LDLLLLVLVLALAVLVLLLRLLRDRPRSGLMHRLALLRCVLACETSARFTDCFGTGERRHRRRDARRDSALGEAREDRGVDVRGAIGRCISGVGVAGVLRFHYSLPSLSDDFFSGCCSSE